MEDGVVLLVGQEDVVLLPDVLAKLGFTFGDRLFGWGTGGAPNMQTISSLLHDLGFQKVCGILDGDKRDEIPTLEANFGDYKYVAIPANDLRGRKEQSAKPALPGLLDENRQLRSEHEVETRRTMQIVQDYISDRALLPANAS